VIGAVAVLLAALILPYFQKWLVQRSQIEAARASVSQSQHEVQALNEQLAQWQDDQYVKAQARERLHYVMPGEIGYVVVPPARDQQSGTSDTPGEDAAKVAAGDRPWYSNLWISTQVAGAGTSP
jgi:Tfp pilus assembly major pilin PilA